MYSSGAALVVILVLVLWLGYLTYQFYQITGLLEKLFPSEEGSFKQTLAEVLRQGKDLDEFRKINLQNIQKVGLFRYNPYQDTGGDQSFSLSLLNGEGDGVVITSLHARAGTRVFAKSIRRGKSDSIKLSSEEENVVKQAYESI